MKRIFLNTLYFTRRERNGAVALCLFVLVSLAIPELQERMDRGDVPPPALPGTWPVAAALTAAQTEAPFPFDPNTATEEELRRLGLTVKTTRSILNYRNKGGRFRKPEDFGKIYTLPQGDYERLLPFVRIASMRKDPSAFPIARPGNNLRRDSWPDNPYNAQYRRKSPQPIDINMADTTDWQSLPGIGAWRAVRIVGFRDRLGGFVAPGQVGETFGLPDSVFQNILPYLTGGGVLKKVNVNTATMDELKAHPYISPKEAGKIAAWRVQQGPFRSASELESIFSGNGKWTYLKAYLAIDAL
ncbi:MAG: helix-hairpin-helix domain-containing protein [Saprospiraceae bacterium]|nr:helix-hairpin-helix domain-containing protein [Saprospiraceae bacterium]